ncbi:MAG: AmmeMemoRadiSam system protein B [Nitrospirae bacterium]|nr:AmmeMemoRadiSam system protein B [Nitrospirota bacterium]
MVLEKGIKSIWVVLLTVVLSVLPACKKDIKEPSVSGAFYPSNPETLSKMIDGFLEKANPPSLEGSLVMLFSPHAGYIYSGEVAAYTYKTLKGFKKRLIILVGPSHYARFKGASVFMGDYLKTPLGLIEVDKAVSASLINDDADCKYYPEAYRKEHSLEVQLPFLQKTLKDFKTVLILIGSPSRESFRFLSKRLSEIMKRRKDAIIIISTDLSHYHPYSVANEMDHEVVNAIEHLSIEDLEKLLQSKKGEMCGSYPALLGLSVARALGATHGKLLRYANSGDTAGRKDSVVGYASIAILKAPLTEGQKQYLLKLARQTIETYVKTGKTPEPEVKDVRLLANGATFVTIYKKGHLLRGCIGNIFPFMPLYKSVIRNAVAAASRDPRFRPLQPSELEDIEVEVTVLSPLEQITDIREIEIGKHGLYIVKDGRSGILLPQVATEFGWNREQFLQAVSEKAGLPPDAWKDATLYRFTAEIIKKDNITLIK